VLSFAKGRARIAGSADQTPSVDRLGDAIILRIGLSFVKLIETILSIT
jgi:hypothetical protein